MGVECFLLVEGEEAERSLRRYNPDGNCPNGGIHNTSIPIGRHALVKDNEGALWIDPDSYLTHPGWPTHCSCGYEFVEDDYRRIEQDPIYVAADGRGEWTLSQAPPGAIWVAWWMPQDGWGVNGGTGPAYVIKLPNGHEFTPGMQATNCDRKGEDHDCWCVHGEAPALTINKNPEPGRTTCSAGAGSIWSKQGQPDEWHGFVTNGELVGT